MVVIVLFALFLSMPVFGATVHPSAARTRAVEAFIDEMTAKHGFDRRELEAAFQSTQLQPQVVAMMQRSAEPKPWDDYRALFVTPEKIAGGQEFWRANARALELARQRYGVPEEIVTAVIGIETHYGRHTGHFRVLDALCTLAFDYPKRALQFRLELEHFLLLSREESMPLGSPLGSYAGAMGIAQFMPGSYRRYAIDFDGDGKRDLFDDPSDAIGSVANFLTAHGWQREGPIAATARVSASAAAAFRESKLETRLSLDELRSKGVESKIAPGSRTAIPLTLLKRRGAEYWLGFDNFYVITRYNRSVYYAMAVFQLSEAIRNQYHQAKATDQP